MYVHKFIYIYTCIYIYICIYVYVYIYIYLNIHTHTHTHTLARAHTHTHTHTHTHKYSILIHRCYAYCSRQERGICSQITQHVSTSTFLTLNLYPLTNSTAELSVSTFPLNSIANPQHDMYTTQHVPSHTHRCKAFGVYILADFQQIHNIARQRPTKFLPLAPTHSQTTVGSNSRTHSHTHSHFCSLALSHTQALPSPPPTRSLHIARERQEQVVLTFCCGSDL